MIDLIGLIATLIGTIFLFAYGIGKIAWIILRTSYKLTNRTIRWIKKKMKRATT